MSTDGSPSGDPADTQPEGPGIHQETIARNQPEPDTLCNPGNRQLAANSDGSTQASNELERQLLRAQKMEVVGQLAGGAAHDFNNLLTVINGYADLLLSRREPPESVHGYLQLIRDAGERAATLASRLLAFSRPKVEESTLLNLNGVVDDMCTLLRRLLPSDIEMVHRPEPRLDNVLADVGLMEQVLMNLAVNARDAMPEGGRIEIETANLDVEESAAAANEGIPPGRYVVLTVTDTGVGMDESTKARLFEPFFTTKPAGVGTGLGLSTVYRIVKQSGGWISVRSEERHGTCISVYLPARSGDTSSSVLRSHIAPERGSGTILVVDDNAEVLQFTADALANLGYTSLSASSGQAAMDWVSNFEDPIDLLLIDLVLPDGNGRDIADRLTALRPGLPVLFTSGYPDQASAAREVPRPVPEFLPKPFTAETLGRRVQEILRQRHFQRILVIDDDRPVVAFARRTLSEAGFDVRAAENGSRAVSVVREHSIDLVITDLIMPESEGLETIRTLRQEFPSLPIIATSGAFEGQFLKYALKFGVQAVIPKPFSAVELLDVVRRTLGIGAHRAGH